MRCWDDFRELVWWVLGVGWLVFVKLSGVGFVEFGLWVIFCCGGSLMGCFFFWWCMVFELVLGELRLEGGDVGNN